MGSHSQTGPNTHAKFIEANDRKLHEIQVGFDELPEIRSKYKRHKMNYNVQVTHFESRIH
jgi:hypothetical protein